MTVNETAQQLIDAKVPIVAFWMQDWVGLESFMEGQRLTWDWKLNTEYYPHWQEMKNSWAEKGIRPMIYINPYFANVSIDYHGSETQSQFYDAINNGYFIKNQDGSPKLLWSASIQFGCVDLSNPDARTWVKGIIQENMIEEAGAYGWMHDFGEYVTLDSLFWDQVDPIKKGHNDYPNMWAEVVKEAIEESGVPHAQDIVPFMRSGSTKSPGSTRLFWMGDQLPSIDQYDGMWSALIGQLNGGLSGFTIGHSDIGGYTTVYEVFGLYKYVRTPELLKRWIEMNTFSDMIMRTHCGLIPQHMAQVWDDDDTTNFFTRFVNIHISLKNYKMKLMQENEKTGVAPLRALIVEYEDDPYVKGIRDQFMLGTDLMMAPMVVLGIETRDVYMPQGNWTHYFTNDTYDFTERGDYIRGVAAPLGQPLVFIKDQLKDEHLGLNPIISEETE